jgi:hypothetical protein
MNEFISSIEETWSEIKKPPPNEIQQPPYRLGMHEIEPFSLVSPSHKWRTGHSGSFGNIPQDVILHITNGLSCFYIYKRVRTSLQTLLRNNKITMASKSTSFRTLVIYRG